jgi:acyl transferase domain-containing protein/SAM-dependent methyltransferase/acyl carrier protein
MAEPAAGIEPIAVIGLALRVPGAASPDSFWQLLRSGREGITRFDRAQLLAAGVPPALIDDPAFVGARGIVDGIDLFDADLFGQSPRQAAATDPQHRLFLECCWEALESAGHAPGTTARIGVYAGAGMNTYLVRHVVPAADAYGLDDYEILIGNDKDFLPLRVSYQLDLTGPSLSVSTACSTSLVAVHMACQALLAGECDLALAGGVSIRLPQIFGFRHAEGMILSPDGHCRPYDATAAGTVSADGVGVVLLKRLADAEADGDVVRAVIRGSAINNDGGRKVGFTAPSVEGQARVLAEALAVAGVSPASIGYVEGHGTGTKLGDPLEVAALNAAYKGAERIALGSVKSNVGHLDTAAGVVGLIKVVLGLEHGEIPPSLHFTAPNPTIDFAAGPFQVAQALAPWPAPEGVRRGSVSSFGIGGTNAHVVLEAARARAPGGPARPWQVLPVSARSEAALGAQCEQLAAAVTDSSEALADIAYTLALGRRAFPHRKAVAARDLGAAAQALQTAPGQIAQQREIVFLFPGQGTQRLRMGRSLFAERGVYHDALRDSVGHLSEALKLDLLGVLYPDAGDEIEAAAALNGTAVGQAALFAVCYALARQWEALEVRAAALVGHSLGDYVAATLAGVFTLADAARSVAARGRLMEQARGGAMLAVALDEAAAGELCGLTISLAAVNGPQQCVLSGDAEAIALVESRLATAGTWSRRLKPPYGFHSHLLDEAMAEFAALVATMVLSPPQRRMVSSMTGEAVAAAQARDPTFWARQMRAPVRFLPALRNAASAGNLFLEVGPGTTLTGLARAAAPEMPVVATWPSEDEDEGLAQALARIWEAGGAVDWAAVHAFGARRRVVLPGTVFERQRYWLEPTAPAPSAPASNPHDTRPHLYAPVWRRLFVAPQTLPEGPWLVLQGGERGTAIAAALTAAGQIVVQVTPGPGFARHARLAFTGDPASRADHAAVLAALQAEGLVPREIVHALALDAADDDLLDHGFHAAFALAQALIAADFGGGLTLLTSGAADVTGMEPLRPEAAPLRGLAQVLPQEHPRLRCRLIDVVPDQPASTIVADLGLAAEHGLIARRGRQLWKPDHQELARATTPLLRRGGVYLITGGTGGIGRALARHLAGTYDARVALVSRGKPAAEAAEPAFAALVDRLAECERIWRECHGRPLPQETPPLRHELDALASALAHDCLHSQGVAIAPGAPVDRDEIVRRLGVLPRFARLVDAMLHMVVADDVGRTAAAESRDADAIAAAIRHGHPALAPLLSFLSNAVKQYPAALTGRHPAIEVIYPTGDPQALARAMRGMVAFSQYEAYASLLGDALLALAERTRGRPLRVIEVGGGSGVLTRALLARLAGHDISYTFSDIGKSLVLEMECWAREAGQAGMDFCVFDVTRPWADQGLAPAEFDAVIGLDVVHATPDIAATVANLAGLIRPGGALLLLESVNPPRFFDLLFGLAEGWWSYTDTHRRQHSPLLPLAGWEEALRLAGLAAQAFPREAAGRAATDIGLVMGWKTGGEIMHATADVTDGAALAAAIAATEARFGPINGVIHAAGELFSGPIAMRGRDDIAREFAARIAGTRTLDVALGHRRLDFLMLCSSVAGIAPGPGDAGHAAACAFLDAYADMRTAEGRPTVSVGWDRWESVGLATRLEALYERRTGQPMPPGLTLPAALAAFEAVLTPAAPPHVVVARSWPRAALPAEPLPQSQPVLTAPTPRMSLHARPPLATPYVPPTGPLEQQIAQLWSSVLGIAEIGRDDDLVALGGDSLIAIQIVARLRETLAVALTVRALFEEATVAAVARRIETLRWHAAAPPQAPLAVDEVEGVL